MHMRHIMGGLMISISVILSSCSVYKASSNEGVSLEAVSKCHSKADFLGAGMHLLDKSKSHDGKYIEIYRAVHKKGGGN